MKNFDFIVDDDFDGFVAKESEKKVFLCFLNSGK